MFAPSEANFRAIAFPIPRTAPVTSGRLVPFGVGVALQDEHDVRVPDVLDRGQLFTGHDPDAFVVLAEALG